LVIIEEVSIAKNSRKIKKDGSQGSLFIAFILPISPSKLSIIGCDTL